METLPVPSHLFKEVFGNELVLDYIFKNLENPSIDLISCRSVSNKWKRRATKSLQKWNWKNRKFVTLNGEKDVQKYLDTFAPFPSGDSLVLRGGRRINKSSGGRIFPEETEIPHQCFKIDLSSRGKNCNNSPAESLEPFFKTFNQRIKSLKLKLMMNTTLKSDGFEDFELENILRTQSNSLDEFCLAAYNFKNYDCYRNSGKGKKSNVKVGGSEFTEAQGGEFQLTKLNYLSIMIEHNLRDSFQDRILEPLLNKIPKRNAVKICLLNWDNIEKTIRLFEQYDQIKNLKVFQVKHLANNGELKLLADAGAKLDFLHTRPNSIYNANAGNYVPTKDVYDFLCFQVQNLEMLFWGSEWKFRFPWPMSALRRLCLVYDKYNIINPGEPRSPEEEVWLQNDRQINYNEYFPQLEELHLKCIAHHSLSHQEFKNWVFSPQSPCTSLRNVGIDFIGFNIENLQTISFTFPQITSLTISRTFVQSRIERHNFFKTLWGAQFAPILEEFFLTYSLENDEHGVMRRWGVYEADSLFSGENKEKIEQIIKSGDYDSWQSEPGSLSILNFKSLKTLSIGIWLHRQTFTDFSAYCLFGRLENLWFLNFDLARPRFSKDAEVSLRRKIRQVPIPIESAQDRLDKVFGTSFAVVTGQVKDYLNNFRDMA